MNRSVHLEFACQARKSYKVTFLSQIGNGPEVPIGKYLNVQEQVLSIYKKTLISAFRELCNKRADEMAPVGLPFAILFSAKGGQFFASL